MYSVMAGISINHVQHDVSAIVGSSAIIKTNGDFQLDATLINKVSTRATGTSEINNQETTTDTTKKVSAGVAISYGDYKNHANAEIETGAQVDASGALDVHTDVRYPFFMNNLSFEQFVNAFKNKNDLKDLSLEILSTLFTAIHLINGGATTGAKGETKSGDTAVETAVTGALVMAYYDTESTATIGEDAQLNQDVNYQTAEQSVSVEAKTKYRLLNSAGPLEADSPKDSITGLGGTNESGKYGIGGAGIVNDFNSHTEATIRRGAMVRTGADKKLDVNADEDLFYGSFALQSSKSGGLGIAGSFNYLSQDSTTIAHVQDGVTISTGSLNVTANSDQQEVLITGGLQRGKSVGAGVSISIADVGRDVRAIVGDDPDNPNDLHATKSTSITAKGMHVQADSSGYLTTASVAGASVSNTKADAAASAASPSTGGNASGVAAGVVAKRSGLGIAGEASWNTVQQSTHAIVDTSGSITLSGNRLEVLANDTTNIYAISGAAALAKADNRAIALSGAFSRNDIDTSTQAILRNATVTGVGRTDVQAVRSGELFALSISAAAGLATAAMRKDRNLGGAIAGSFSWNTIDSDTNALIDNAPITGTSDVNVKAENDVNLRAIGGGAGLTNSGFGVGAGVGINEVDSDTTARVIGASSVIHAGGDVTVAATSETSISAVGFSIGAGTFGLAGTVGINSIEGSTLATVEDASIHASQNIAVTTLRTDAILSGAGALAIGFSLGDPTSNSGTYAAAAGAAVAINAIGGTKSETAARVLNATLDANDGIQVKADNKPSIDSYAFGAAGAVAIGSSAGSSGSVALSGAGTRNTIDTDVEALVSGSQLTTTSSAVDGNITIAATDTSHILVDAGVSRWRLLKVRPRDQQRVVR